MRARFLVLASMLSVSCGSDGGSVPANGGGPTDSGQSTTDTGDPCAPISKIEGVKTGTFDPLALQVDAAGAAHIAWNVGETGGGIGYATNRSGRWVIEEISPAGRWPAMALDASGFAHVVWTEGGRSNGYTSVSLSYATNASGSWVTSSLEDSASYYAKIAIARDGAIHVAYSDRVASGASTHTRAAHATKTSTGWVFTPVETKLDNASIRALMLDSAGSPHILYGQPRETLHGWMSAGTWMTETIDAGMDTAAAIDSEGHIHAIVAKGTLSYLTNASGAWTTTPITTTADGSWSAAAVAIDASGRLHVTAHGEKDNVLFYAVGTDGAFERRSLPSGVFGADNHAIALASDGVVHLAFGSLSHAELRCTDP